MVRVMNQEKTSEGSRGSSFSGKLLAEVEIQVKEGGTGLHKTIREINLVYKGLIVHGCRTARRVEVPGNLPHVSS